MAIITCPECGKDVSDKADKCPHCGFNIRVDQIGKKIAGIQNHKVTKKQGCIGCFSFFVLIILFAAIANTCKDDEKSSETEKAQVVQEIKTPEQLRTEKIQSCFSMWDGEHHRIKRYLQKNYLNDPDSYKHIDTKIHSKEKSDTILVVTSFSASNAFGGRVKNSVIYKTVIPKNTEIELENPNWCPIFDIVFDH